MSVSCFFLEGRLKVDGGVSPARRSASEESLSSSSCPSRPFSSLAACRSLCSSVNEEWLCMVSFLLLVALEYLRRSCCSRCVYEEVAQGLPDVHSEKFPLLQRW